MNDILAASIIVGIICWTIYSLFELFARRKERIIFIEKITEIQQMGKIEGSIDFSFGRPFPSWALRVGCLLIGLGIGLMAAFWLSQPYIRMNDVTPQIAETVGVIYGGCLLISGGLSLIVAFFVERKYIKNKNS